MKPEKIQMFGARFNFVLVGIMIFILQACTTSAGQDQLQSSTPSSETIPTYNLPAENPTLAHTPNASPLVPDHIIQPTATKTTVVKEASPFEKQNFDPDTGEIRSLWVDPSGQLWFGAKGGVFVHKEGSWEKVYDGPAEKILGIDTNGMVWVILEGEARIAAYDGTQTWQVFGADQGWSQPSEVEYLSPGYGDGLVSDPKGRVWLATGRDEVRVFDSQEGIWTIISSAEMGFSPAEAGYQGHFLSDVQLSRSQKVWVADCIAEGDSLKGQGIRWTDGVDWFLAPDTAAECVLDVEMDDKGKMWVGGFDELLMYDPDLGYWTRFPLPDWERGQLVTEIDLDANGTPWVEVMQFGGAGPLGRFVRYHLKEGEWIEDFEGWSSSLAITEPGVAWLCSEGSIVRLQNGRAEQIGEIPGEQCEIQVDGSRRVWVTNYSELWLFDPGD